MVDILHRVGMKSSSPDDVYAALGTIDGVAGWWTRATTGDASVGGVIQFRFELDGGETGGMDGRVVESVPGKRVAWEVIDGPEEWIGTTITFDIKQDGDWTIVLFSHSDWREPVEFMHHCSTKWATFLMSLKAFVETGQGSPAPADVKISNWH
jgi:uncharacterized protein YndB with AHSA1/START domain